MLFASTAINYLDRQTLSLLAPYLKVQYRWTNTDYAHIVIAFRVAYTIGQSAFGFLMDRIGTRRGLTLTVLWYSVVSILTSAAHGFRGFVSFRFLLGAGESANWPGATKAVSEWFPKRERALATAIFDSGSSIGGAIAPFVVLPIFYRWGWRPAFVIPGVLGLIWLVVWRSLYRQPEKHPRISPAELKLVVSDKTESRSENDCRFSLSWTRLLMLPQTWGTIVARSLTDPVWFFITDWFPIYLAAKGIALKTGTFAVWIPFIAADLGNLFSGTMSGYLIGRGWSVGAARKALVVFGGVGMTMLLPTVLTTNVYLIACFFAIATFAYASFSTMANVFPSDLFNSGAVASVSGLSGTGAGLGTIVAFELIGYFSDARSSLAAHSFDPIVIIAGLIPFVGMVMVLLLVRNNNATKAGLVRPI